MFTVGCVRGLCTKLNYLVGVTSIFSHICLLAEIEVAAVQHACVIKFSIQYPIVLNIPRIVMSTANQRLISVPTYSMAVYQVISSLFVITCFRTTDALQDDLAQSCLAQH